MSAEARALVEEAGGAWAEDFHDLLDRASSQGVQSSLQIVYDVVAVISALATSVALYFIEVAVMALLTNVGLTASVVFGCFVMYATMVILVHVGVLPPTAPLLICGGSSP